ncbi:UDP-N-acetylglucosamine 2-epimerase (hydrolyzing) [Paenibacillus polymyxa]|uniref:UDP-N-acetylglucosamine 2-epimerase n=1 Tax=Paenibacillus polymyxa TaxID=1406 RepID=UPI00278FD18D|nr:UDP-N-acetylglucosamine 2-epimerase [Paenibacillus polymyxa]MDQ0048940.1 UDP-N-acetylglucosamine 2-epimerase (hydrolyzing) [Paenibacillus polymyxa]
MEKKRIENIVFITGTRADYGKLKPLINEAQKSFNVSVYVCGMHLLEQFGYTYQAVLDDNYKNVYCASGINYIGKMDVDLASTLIDLNAYLQEVKPDLLVVHGDRVEALAGAISGMLNNILVAHVEGGEVTGTVDEAIRHSVSKMAQFHFVANYECKLRVLQLGEKEENIFVIGSPDIDVMVSSKLPSLEIVKRVHKIPFQNYAILIYHPVTTELSAIQHHIQQLLNATEASGRNYIIIYPNNDLGSDIIINEIEKYKDHERFKLFRSLPFEDFLSLLKHAQFIIGNSSAGIREACVYGLPAIDLGSRQQGRYQKAYLRNVQHTREEDKPILSCINQIKAYKIASSYFGTGNSARLFVEALKSKYEESTQKKFVDIGATEQAIQNYINEVCF